MRIKHAKTGFVIAAQSSSFARCNILGGVLADECDRLFEAART